MFDVKSNNTKDTSSKALKRYKGFQGTIKSAKIEKLTVPAFKNTTKEVTCVATCGLDRFLRVHNIETSELVSKVYLKSRLNCLLFSKHEPVKVNGEKSKKNVDEDQLSSINSEDLGTDDLWSDMEQIVEEHPNMKRKVDERLNEFDSEISETENQPDTEEPEFKMPK